MVHTCRDYYLLWEQSQPSLLCCLLSPLRVAANCHAEGNRGISMKHLFCDRIAEIGVADDGSQFKIVAGDSLTSRELALPSAELPRLLVGLLRAGEFLSRTGINVRMAFPVEEG